MKTKIISKMLLSLGLVFVLGSAITQVYGEDEALPVVSIHSTGDVTRGQTGSFVLKMNPPLMFGGIQVNFSVSGTAIQGVDYIALVSPAYIGHSGYATLLVKTLADARGGSQAYSVIVTLKAGPGYTIDAASSSAKMMIKPSNILPCCQ
jgi:hypothetical protein